LIALASLRDGLARALIAAGRYLGARNIGPSMAFRCAVRGILWRRRRLAEIQTAQCAAG
jgi:hypothetical protein